ncbi:catechol 2,3-dioxygenase-like lactoylglutathione lyase family enzyme [Metabacillus crassostreae]|uniref:VOC family protein n=1 Tax=Metabacillus crassostreae TaxID=929098 RepID=UPI00195CD4A6|nr:VOC family protein [Metabacillus crassostreae]MBM7602971.1 catechol 2,3-dioxygenase-like lactoylglutathione lyase family enzyme [Metabacillus crassostreae]
MKYQNQEKFVERIDAVFLPVRNLEESIKWYQEIFSFDLRWKNERMCGLFIATNCGFHLVETQDFKPITTYTPFNYVVKDVEKTREKLLEKGVVVSQLRTGEPKRFDITDLNGNMISIIQL